MSPTVFRAAGLRFAYYSNEGGRLHVHAFAGDREAKIWIEPVIELAENRGLTRRQLSKALQLVREHEAEVRKAWREHFGA